MTTYEGIFDKTGYRVTAKDLPLPCYKVYTQSRDWSTDDGRKQLALDILIDFLVESPSGLDIRYKETEIAAWVPHLAYTKMFNVSPPGLFWWRMQSEQVRIWLDDWLKEHSKNVLTYTNWKHGMHQRVGRRFYELDEAAMLKFYMRGWDSDRALAAMEE